MGDFNAQSLAQKGKDQIGSFNAWTQGQLNQPLNLSGVTSTTPPKEQNAFAQQGQIESQPTYNQSAAKWDQHVTERNQAFDDRYKTDWSGSGMIKNSGYQNANRAYVRDWLRQKGINPYSLSGSQRRQIRQMMQNGSMTNFDTDMNTLFGNNQPRGDQFKGVLQSQLSDPNYVQNYARQKFYSDSDKKYYAQNTQPATVARPGLKAGGDQRVYDWQKQYGNGLVADGLLGPKTAQAMRAAGVNVNDYGGERSFGIKKKEVTKPQVARKPINTQVTKPAVTRPTQPVQKTAQQANVATTVDESNKQKLMKALPGYHMRKYTGAFGVTRSALYDKYGNLVPEFQANLMMRNAGVDPYSVGNIEF